MRISPGTYKNFQLYLKCYEVFGSTGFDPWKEGREILSNPNGYTALECFNFLDNSGQNKPCCEPELFNQVQAGKTLLNFNIEQWVIGIKDQISCLGELQENYPWLPPWVWKSVIGQLGDKPPGRWEFSWYIKTLLNG